MLKQLVAGIGLLIMASCHPVYADDTNTITAKHCSTVRLLSRQMLIDIQKGATQYEIMDRINNHDFGKDGYPAKVYMQLTVNDYVSNIHRGFRVQQILDQVQRNCEKMIGFSF